MKKMLSVMALLLGMASLSHAGTPRETFFQNQFPMSNSSIVISTYTGSGAVQTSLSMSQAPGSVNGSSCRNCFTRFYVQMSTNVVLNVVDGLSAGTTVYLINGVGLGASGVNSLNLAEDHLGPLCLTAGNTTVFNAVATVPFVGTASPVAVNVEGYTDCGGSNNKGQ